MSQSDPSNTPPPIENGDLVSLCEELIGFRFENPELLREALTHSSGADTASKSNERLEFLGDAVLGMTVCDYLYRNHPSWDEGELTKIKSAVVSWQSCTEWARKLELERVILVGKGVTQRGELPVSILADGFEAIVGAIYLDQGPQRAKNFLLPFIQEQVQIVQQCSVANNYKSAFQHYVQREFSSAPNYIVLEEVGPDHDKSFRVAARVAGRQFPSAWGKTKKEAEQKAAELALTTLEAETAGPPAE
jgi:ribonuclease-3